MTPSAHADTFARDNLPPQSQWPEFRFDLPELQYPERMNCAGVLLDDMVVAGHSGSVAIRTYEGQCTYLQLQAQANRIANVLVREMGVVPGNRVLLRGPNNPMMAACWLAVMKAGGVCVGTMPLLRAKELTDIVTKAQVSHALCDTLLSAELEAALPACPTLQAVRYWSDGSSNSLDTLIERQSIEFENVDTAADDVALIAFTSGTTGKPKGTMHFHRDVIAMCDCFPRSCLKPVADDVFVGTPPLAFTFGLGGLLCFPMRFGASTVLLEKLTPESLLDAVGHFIAEHLPRFGNRNLRRRIGDFLHHLLDGEQIDLPGVGVESRLQVFAGLVVLARSRGDGFFDGGDDDVGLNPFFLGESLDGLL